MTTTHEKAVTPVRLRDGILLTDLVDEQERSIATRLLSDPEIYELELDRIFGRCWQFVAHESELPAPGSFVTRWMADDSVIVSRDSNGEFNVLLNVCSHRGAAVCRASEGQAMRFTCPYHGWVYENTGAVSSVFAEPVAYGEGVLDKSRLGLRRARVATYQGFVFATWDYQAPPLDEYIGEYAWYLDVVFGAIGGGLEVIGPPVRWEVPTNWKVAAENLSGDSYHVATTHRSLFEIGLIGRTGGTLGAGVRSVADEFAGVSVLDPVNGHGTLCLGLVTADELEAILPYAGIPSSKADEVRARLTPEQVQLLMASPPVVGNVFPNFSFLNSPFPTEFGEPPRPLVTVRTWLPRGPQRTEVLSWPVTYKQTSPELRELVRKTTIRSFSPTGNFEQDDLEVWSTIASAAGGHQGGKRRLHLAASVAADNSTWAGPLQAHPGALVEDNQWNFYKTWLRHLTAAEKGWR